MFVRLTAACLLLVLLAVCAMFAAARVPVFKVTGNLSTRLAPGIEVPLDLTISNKHSYAIRVRGMVVTIASVHNGSSDPHKRCAIDNFSVTQAVGVTPLLLKPHSSVSLRSLGVAMSHWPKVTMLQVSKGAQAKCENAHLTLRYSAPGWFWTE